MATKKCKVCGIEGTDNWDEATPERPWIDCCGYCKSCYPYDGATEAYHGLHTERLLHEEMKRNKAAWYSGTDEEKVFLTNG